jgi:hypothetical protein
VVTFFSTVFLAVLALFGLLVAALIYVAQTVQDRYSTRVAQRILRGRLSLSFWALGVGTLLLASLGLFVDAYWDQVAGFVGKQILAAFGAAWFGAITLVGALVVMALFALTLRGYARLLSPLTVLDEIGRGLTPASLRDIALFRLHHEDPVVRVLVDGIDLDTETAHLRGASAQSASAGKVAAEATRRSGPLTAWARRVAERCRGRKPSRIERIKTAFAKRDAAGNLEDPFGDLLEYGSAAISKNNGLAWRAFVTRVTLVFGESIGAGFLDKNSEVPFLADRLLLEGFARLAEEIEVSRRYSYFVVLNEAIESVCRAFGAANDWVRVSPFLTYLQDIGTRALLRHDHGVFRSCIRALTSVGIASVRSESESRGFDDVCRSVGWLGERLILRGIEDSPIMPSGAETEELGEITEAIYRLGNAVSESSADKYPLILRDAIEVICEQALNKNDPQKLEEPILSLLSVHEERARELIAKNSKSAGAYLYLLLTDLKKILNYDLSAYRELRRAIFSWVGMVACEAVEHNQPANEFARGRIPGARDLQGLIISFAVQMGEPHDWDAAMMEVFTRSIGRSEDPWPFIKRAGVQLHSNFGLMFDPDSGDDYPPDDPRRR